MRTAVKLACAALIAATAAPSTVLAAKPWWPFPVEATSATGQTPKTMEYTPPMEAAKHWHLCALSPNLADSYWVAVNYGMVAEARRLHVALTTLAAGGYSHLSKQISQFDDCVASKANAILLSPISEAGFIGRLNDAAKKGLVVIAVANPIVQSPVTAKITVSHYQKGFISGRYLVKTLGSAGGKVVAFPGPQGSGWAERYMAGFVAAVKGTRVDLLAEKYGGANVPDQLNLVTDALQAYPSMTAIWGGAPTAEAAIGAVAEAGRPITIVSSWEDQEMLHAIESGKVIGFAAEYPVIMGRIGVDLAVQALQGSLPAKVLDVVPRMVTTANLGQIDVSQIFAPKGFRPVFEVR